MHAIRETCLWWHCKLYTARKWIAAQVNFMEMMGFVPLSPGEPTELFPHHDLVVIGLTRPVFEVTRLSSSGVLCQRYTTWHMTYLDRRRITLTTHRQTGSVQRTFRCWTSHKQSKGGQSRISIIPVGRSTRSREMWCLKVILVVHRWQRQQQLIICCELTNDRWVQSVLRLCSGALDKSV